MMAPVVDTLPLLASAPGGTPLLRELILELASNGRLGSADVGWRATHLRELVVSSGAGWSPSCDARARCGDEWGVLKVSAVSWGRFQPDENKALPKHLEPRPELEVHPGDFLVSRANTADLVARSVVVEDVPPKLMLSDKIVRLRLSETCDPRFIQIANSAPEARRYYASVAGGTSSSMKNVSREQILDLPILLPPLPEQHRIVAKVDELMALCDRLEARQQDAEAAHARLVQALLDSLTQARGADEFQACWQRVEESFFTLFTTDGALASLRRAILRCGVSGHLSQRLGSDRSAQDLLREVSASRDRLASAGRAWSLEDVPQASRTDLAFEIPEAWAVVRAAEVCWPITSGSTPPASEMHESLGIPFLKVYNIRNQAIDFGYKPQFVSDSYHDTKLRRSCLQPGDIVMNIVGPPLGKVAVVPDDFPEWNCNQAIVGFRLIPPMVPAFLYLYLCEGSFLQGIELIGTAGQDNISVTKSKHLPIPVPPMEEQHRIVAKVTDLLTLCDQLKARITAARAKHAQLAEALVAQAVAA